MAPRKRAASAKAVAVPAEPMDTEMDGQVSQAGSGSKASKKAKKAASHDSTSALTNGHSPTQVSPPAKRSKRTEPDPEAPTINGDSKGSRKKNASKTPETIPEDEELKNTDNVDKSSEESQPSSPPLVTGVKRSRQRSSSKSRTEAPVKRMKLTFRHQRGWGQLLTVGQGDTGQLGLGEDVMEKMRPAPVPEITEAVDAVAGGMHTAVLDRSGAVWTFGCNDEGSLGRLVEEEEDCFVPGKVEIGEKVVMLSAGDSHTAALADSGQVYLWGTFRDSSGAIGLVEAMKIEKLPVKVLSTVHIIKIASGVDHLVMLSSEGQIWTMGNSEQGQLGRINEKFAHRGGRRGLMSLLKPEPVRVNWKTKITGFKDIWAGSYNTVARAEEDQMMVMGLNNYAQLALPTAKALSFFMPQLSKEMTKLAWNCVAIGQHHVIGVEQSGQVYALGRKEYGRLGLGEDQDDATVPTLIQGGDMDDVKCLEVACGTAVSYAVTEAGDCLAWGFGANGQLGTGEEEDVWAPLRMVGKHLKDKKVLVVSSGGQHTVIIARDN